jgi:hypothetical protein
MNHAHKLSALDEIDATINRTSVDEPCKRGHRRAFAGASASAQESIMQTERDQYADLEKPIEDVHNMAAIVTRVMEREAGFEARDVTISAQSWETFSFAVYHLQELANNLHKRYHRDGEAMAA